jgi:hypothetical protein
MTDAELEILIEELRVAASAWFNNKELLKLEELIREAQHARAEIEELWSK